jgi:hypothetical protein
VPELRRIELFAVAADAPGADIERFERALLEAPLHSPVRRARVGRCLAHRHGWTHVWEHEFSDAAALQDYMADAYHWSVLDPFVDATNPSAIVERVTVVAYESATATGPTQWPSTGLRRLLLIRLDPVAHVEATAALAETITAAADELPLSGWRLAAALPHRHGWSLVWEQLFADRVALDIYMRHPFHWSRLDPFFDPDNPAVIVAATTMACYAIGWGGARFG